MYPIILSALAVIVICSLYLYKHNFSQYSAAVFKVPLLVSLCLSLTAFSIWYLVIEPSKPEVVLSASKKAQGKTIDAILLEIEEKLKQDRNNADLWFQLGQGYFADGRFESASTCFSYVLRLTDEPSSTVFAAKATADYYINSQRITDGVQRLIDEALSRDPLNDTALMLIANDYFLSFEYQKAIDIWQQVLDSDRPNIDRVTLINSINRTREMMN